MSNASKYFLHLLIWHCLEATDHIIKTTSFYCILFNQIPINLHSNISIYLHHIYLLFSLLVSYVCRAMYYLFITMPPVYHIIVTIANNTSEYIASNSSTLWVIFASKLCLTQNVCNCYKKFTWFSFSIVMCIRLTQNYKCYSQTTKRRCLLVIVMGNYSKWRNISTVVLKSCTFF